MPVAARLARADDRRGGLLVDAVRLADLDVDEPGVGERLRRTRARVSAPAMQPVHCCMSARVASSMSSSAITSETAKRPPGRRTRATSRSTSRLVAGEVDARSWRSRRRRSRRGAGSPRCSPCGTRRSRRRPCSAFSRASASISSVMSRPMRLAGRADALGGDQHVDARRRSRGRGPSRPRAGRRRRSGCRSRGRRASAVSGSCSRSPSA